MFTLKKIALIGVAGLAAFSMSCSDSDGTETDNSITKPILEELPVGSGVFKLTGGAAVSSNVGIDSIGLYLKDNSNADIPVVGTILPKIIPVGADKDGNKTLAYDLTVIAETFSFSKDLLTSCPAGTTVNGKLVIKGWFGGDATLSQTSESEFVSFVCPEENIDVPNNIAGAFNDTTEVTLGGTGAAGSAADLDTHPATVYTRALITAAVKDEIDVVYDGTNIYSAGAAAEANKNGGTLSGTTSEAVLVAVTPEEIASIDESNTPVATAISIASTKVLGGADEFGAATVGATFLVITSKSDAQILEVKSVNGTVDAVFFDIRSIVAE